MQTPGSNFLHERNPNLHTSAEVEHVVDYLRAGGESIPNNPADKISAHLGFLARRDYANDGILTGDQSSIDRQIDAHVINAKDVPEGYFELQRRIAREQGHGDVHINGEMRRQMTEAVQPTKKQDSINGLSILAEMTVAIQAGLRPTRGTRLLSSAHTTKTSKSSKSVAKVQPQPILN